MSENTEPVLDPTLLSDVEALLFATDAPLGLERIVALTAVADRKGARAAVDALRAHYDEDERSFTVVEFGGGFSISTRPEHATLVRRLFKGRRKQRLSRAALEALAIIAYKQPVTRIEIEEIRGVAVSGVLGTLLERDLIQIVGRAESLGHPLLYGTTRTFLDYVGLAHVRELPQLSELEDLLAEREDLKQLASSRGEDLAEEDFDRAFDDDEDEGGTEEQEEQLDGSADSDEGRSGSAEAMDPPEDETLRSGQGEGNGTGPHRIDDEAEASA